MHAAVHPAGKGQSSGTGTVSGAKVQPRNRRAGIHSLRAAARAWSDRPADAVRGALTGAARPPLT